MRAVHPDKGDIYSPAVQGGVRSQKVPGVGGVLELADRDVWVPAADLEATLRALGYTVEAPSPAGKNGRRVKR